MPNPPSADKNAHYAGWLAPNLRENASLGYAKLRHSPANHESR